MRAGASSVEQHLRDTVPSAFNDNQAEVNIHGGGAADLLEHHVTQGHSDLTAHPLELVEVVVMQHRQDDGEHRQTRCVAEGVVKSPAVVWVVKFKVLNHLPQEDGLAHFDGLL